MSIKQFFSKKKKINIFKTQTCEHLLLAQIQFYRKLME